MHFLEAKITKADKKALQGSCQADGDNAGMKSFDRLAAGAGAKATPLGPGPTGERHQVVSQLGIGWMQGRFYGRYLCGTFFPLSFSASTEQIVKLYMPPERAVEGAVA